VGARGGAVGWGTALQVGRSRVRFPMISLKFFIDISYRPHYGPGVTQPLTEMSTRNILWGVKAAGARADNLTTFVCRLSWNLGASTPWNPLGLSRTVMGLLYLYIYEWTVIVKYCHYFTVPNYAKFIHFKTFKSHIKTRLPLHVSVSHETILRGLVKSTTPSYEARIRWFTFVIKSCALWPAVCRFRMCVCVSGAPYGLKLYIVWKSKIVIVLTCTVQQWKLVQCCVDS
jgi:hypothetical protein